jgi:formylglycine-generating enzyme required for sulfatase activity
MSRTLEDLKAGPIQDYWLDRYEVTNREFKVCVGKGRYRDQRY